MIHLLCITFITSLRFKSMVCTMADNKSGQKASVKSRVHSAGWTWPYRKQVANCFNHDAFFGINTTKIDQIVWNLHCFVKRGNFVVCRQQYFEVFSGVSACRVARSLFHAFLVHRRLILKSKIDQSVLGQVGPPLLGYIRVDNYTIPAAFGVITEAIAVFKSAVTIILRLTRRTLGSWTRKTREKDNKTKLESWQDHHPMVKNGWLIRDEYNCGFGERKVESLAFPL